MITTSEFILNCLLNSCWQIPVIATMAAVAAYILRNGPARYRHTVWIAALLLSIVVPIVSATQLMPAAAARLKSNPVQPAHSVVATIANSSTEDELSTPLNHVQKRNRQFVSTTSRNVLLLTASYAVFILFGVIRLIRLSRGKERLRRSANPLGPPPQIETIAEYCRRLFGLVNVPVARSNIARVPCTLGVWKPLIVLPEAFYADVDQETLLTVLGHEMAHVSRRDFLTKLICEYISLPISFHPITFLIKRRIERERELSCDELVTEHVLMPEAYARSLLLAADMSILPAPQSVALSIFDGNSLEERIMRLTRNRVLLSRRVARTIVLILLLALCVLAVSLSAFAFELRTQISTSSLPTGGTAPVAQQTVIQSNPPTEQLATIQSNSSNPEERARAACAAGRRRDLATIPTLVEMLGDDNKIQHFICWDTGRWTPALDKFKHPSPGEQAAIALASMGRPAFVPLTNQLNSPNATVRRNAAWAIGELTNMLPGERANAGPRLIALLADADSWVRMAAARALGELKDDRAGETLIATLSDSNWRVRELAVWALNEMKDERAVKALCTLLLSDPRAEVRIGAAVALGEIRSAEALPFLKQALNDPEARVGAKSSWAIAEIEDDG